MVQIEIYTKLRSTNLPNLDHLQVNTAPEIQSMKGSNKLVKSAEPAGNQKRLVEKHSDEKLAITLWIARTGMIAYHIW